MKTVKKKIMAVLILLTVIAAAFGLKYLRDLGNYRQEVSNIEVSQLDIGAMPDGTYQGECDVDFIYAKVSVTVKDGVLTNATLLEHKNERGAPAEKIIDDIVAKQTIDVDVVAGATNSSKVIKKAVENALTLR